MAPRRTSNSPKKQGARRRVRLSVEDRRRQLLDHGLRAFSERPYDSVSIDEIAEQAGVSRGLLFHYYPTKRDYYVAVLERAAEMLLHRTVEATVGDTPDERLAAGLRAYFRFVDDHGPTYATLLRGGVGSDPQVQELVERTRRRIIDAIREGLSPFVKNPDRPVLRTALRGWIGFVEAIALDWIDGRDLSCDELVEMAMRAVAVAIPEADAALRDE